MKITRALLIGAMIWSVAFTSFSVLYYIPSLAGSINLQGLIVGLILAPAAWIGARIYYAKSTPGNGWLVGATMVSTALMLDALITVPFVSLPMDGMGHLQFFSQPILWALVAMNMMVIAAYWKFKVLPNSNAY